MKQLTDGLFAAFAAVALLVSFVILAACSRSGMGVVEAPMMLVDASAVALDDGPIDAGPIIVAVHAGDRFTGNYTCGQGRSQMELTIDEVGREDDKPQVEATFVFHYDGKGNLPGEVDGSYRMIGTFDRRSRRLVLKGEEWIEQPPNYSFVSLIGSLNRTGTTYSGTVEGYSCTTFSATIDHDAPTVKEH